MSDLNNDELLKIVKDQFGNTIINNNTFRDLLTIDVLAKDIISIVSFVRRDEQLDFALLVDVLGVDYLNYNGESVPERFAVVYIFYSLKNACRIRVRAFVSEESSEIQSIYSEYKGADWTEREVYDMFGIHFLGHPNLKRILMPDDYGSYPLRKDYPLKGRGERGQFPKYNIYQRLKD